MRTLDEVINKLESYPVSPSTLPMPVAIVEINDIDDALHYLKDYKWYQIEESQKNEPLTWDELKAMEGKPVWIEYGNNQQSRWDIIYGFHGRENELQYMLVSGVYPDTFWQKDMGADEYWQAYRKERHETGD